MFLASVSHTSNLFFSITKYRTQMQEIRTR
jgi:hypothetical protein